MVLIHTKTEEEKHQFLFETNVDVLVSHLKEDLVQLHNLRCKMLRLLDAATELANHGPLRPEAIRGITDEELRLSNPDIYNPKEATKPDENNFRTGVPPPREGELQLRDAINRAKRALAVDQTEKGAPLTLDKLNELLKWMGEALSACYPSMEGLPPYDPTRLLLENENAFNDHFSTNETSIWWAGKELRGDSTLRSYIGRNEKTKIIIKLHPTKMGPPERERKIDEATYRAMLAYYHKKKKEEKEFEEDDDDSYLNSEWSSPLSLQKYLHGNLANIRWKP
ncbi:CFAP298 domain-containing protein, putative [Plasmodium vivax]|nr:CFAP298 domain-containing protein, putative [Plasmodium vivax]